MKNELFIILTLSILSFQTSCKPEAPSGGEEQITTVKLSFTSGPTIFWRAGEPDPDITLNAQSSYMVKTEFLNEDEPANIIDITKEIRLEDNEHLVCYEVSGGADVTISRTDSDGQYELGLETEWQTGSASSGNLKLLLKHQPGVKDGSCTAGDTDVEVNFNLIIQ